LGSVLSSIVTDPTTVPGASGLEPGGLAWRITLARAAHSFFNPAHPLHAEYATPAVPILPGDAPITAEGLWANEFVPQGRLAQSMAFLQAAGNAAVVLSHQ
jgi:hypothetical protein